MKSLPFLVTLSAAAAVVLSAAAAPSGLLAWTLPIRFEVGSEAARISLAVYDAEGRQIRTLLSGKPLGQGEHEVLWDGRDRLGKPLPAGDYTWRRLEAPGFTARFIGSLGVNHAHGQNYAYWYGNHGPPEAVAVAGDLMVISATAENVPSTLCQTLDGKRVLWTYGQNSHPTFLKTRIFDGRVIAFGRDIWRTCAEVYVLDLSTGKELKRFSVLRERDRETRKAATTYRMATDGTQVAIAHPAEETIVIYDLESQTVARTLEGVAGIEDLEYAGETLHILAAGELKRESAQGFAAVVPAASLNSPAVLAYDAKRDQWLIAEAEGDDRERGQQIKRFDASGKLLATYGRPGGRLNGAWSATDFDQLQALASLDDGSGGFLVAEGGAAVRRVAQIGLDGSVRREWFGPQAFFQFSVADPDDPQRLIFQGGPGSFSIARMNYETGEWTMLESYRNRDLPDLFPRLGHYSVRWWPQRRNGNLYLVSDAQHAGILRIDPEQRALAPVALAAPVPANHPLMIAAAEAQGLTLAEQRGYTWTDRNANQRLDPDEIRFSTVAMPTGTLHIDLDWHVHWRARIWRADTPQSAWTTLPNRTASPEHLPEWGEPEPAKQQLPPAAVSLNASETSVLTQDATGASYMFMNGNVHYGDRHGAQWPTMASGSTRLIRWRPDGSVDWVIGRHAVDPEFVPGYFHEATGIAGFVRGNLIAADRSFGPATAYTPDGLYAGSFFDHRTEDGLPDPVYRWWRNIRTGVDGPVPYDTKMGGSVVEQQGKVYWLPMGNQYTPIYEITGWDDWQRQEGTIHLPEIPAPPTVSPGLRGEIFASLDFSGTPQEIFTHRLWCESLTPVRIPPQRVNWKDGPMAGIGPKDPFSVRWEGRIEAIFTEPWRLVVYNRDTPTPTRGPFWNRDLGAVRVWLGGELFIDTITGPNVTRWMSLEAGKRYDLRVEFVHLGNAEPEFSLGWESTTQERQRIPAAYLLPPAAQERPTLSLRLVQGSTVDDGETKVLRVSASQAPKEDLLVHLSRWGEAAAFSPPLPTRLTIPAGEGSATFSTRLEAMDRFAKLTYALDPVQDWTLEPTATELTFIAPLTSKLFAFQPGELVMLADDFLAPHEWVFNADIVTLADGVLGPVTPSDGRAFTAWRETPGPMDFRENAVIFYLRAKTPGQGYSANIHLNLINSWLGVRIRPGELLEVFGQSPEKSTIYLPLPAPLRELQRTGAAVDYRFEFTLKGDILHFAAEAMEADGHWLQIGAVPLVDEKTRAPFRIRPDTDRLQLLGRNSQTASFEAVAVAIRSLDDLHDQLAPPNPQSEPTKEVTP